MQVTLTELNKIFNKAFDADLIITESTVRDHIGEWTSINHLNLIIELEDFYHIRFTMDEIKRINSVQKLLEALGSK